jgi:broad specificity phosphatase PhoE
MMHALPSSGALESYSGSHGTIYLLRHGAIQSPKDNKCYIGWQDVSLSREGGRQAGNWADYFSGLTLDNIYCSDLTRCLETARIIGTRCALKPKPLSALREIYLGQWEGLRFQTVQTLYPQAFRERGDIIADHRPPGGESFRDLHARVWPVFEAITRSVSGHTLIVTHAGVIRVLLCRLLGMPLENLFCIRQAHGALNIIALRPENRYIQAMNLHSS